MKIIVAGGDGFCGWPTSLYLSEQGHEVYIIDNLKRRDWDTELESQSITPIKTLEDRVNCWEETTGKKIKMYIGDLQDYDFLSSVFKEVHPDAFVHFAEQRAAPYSMIDREHAVFTQVNNVIGTLNVLYAMREYTPECHMIKLGTMGEYGTPNIDIEEGYITIEHKGRKDTLPFPKQPGSFYHLSKVHDSNNIMFACRVWGLKATDLNQGVVYGVQTHQTRKDPRLVNRFDFDGVFGTALNRFCVQAATGSDITVYGQGGQTRGFIDIEDTIRCIELAALNPPESGDFRVFNQFTEEFSVQDLAEKVYKITDNMNLNPNIVHLENPRVEKEVHYYNAIHTQLMDLGLKPHYLTDARLEELVKHVQENKDRVLYDKILPTIKWR
ncbi:MAG: NAD-dependent epimerase/dehydratase family protein [Clostridiales bacterium]|nr:NAD-dependent epimerase/dehydratase family protein [Clostridiales bacterium]MCF8022761.1 NAD-dependent epimerase/dehydratase family protein [Clostridiales bacterium]